jgi:hypothetical protein
LRLDKKALLFLSNEIEDLKIEKQEFVKIKENYIIYNIESTEKIIVLEKDNKELNNKIITLNNRIIVLENKINNSEFEKTITKFITAIQDLNSKNNLEMRHLKNTPRFNFFEEMRLNELEYFDMHGASIGNIIEYRKILLQRAKDEIERITNEYKNHKINENNNLTNEVKDKLINEPRLLMRVKLEKVVFNDNNLVE